MVATGEEALFRKDMYLLIFFKLFHLQYYSHHKDLVGEDRIIPRKIH